jgi:hypothetical protein
LLFQLPQLLLMGVFMRLKREALILGLNIFSIAVFAPVTFVMATNLDNLMLIALNFTLFTSCVYLITFFQLRKNKHQVLFSKNNLPEE